MKINLVRHHETVANRDGIIYGWKDYTYTDKGVFMYENIPRYFADKEILKVYSSPLLRAKRLADSISRETKLETIIDDRLKELNFGILEGTKFDALDKDQKLILDKMFSDFENFQVPGGESGADIRARGGDFFKELVNMFDKKDEVVVVAHAMLIQMALISLLDLDIKKAFSFRMKPGMIIKVRAKNDYSAIEEMINFETIFPSF